MYFDWINQQIKKMTWKELAMDKIAVMAFALLIAKFWPAVLSFEWYWYAVVLVVFKGFVVARIFAK